MSFAFPAILTAVSRSSITKSIFGLSSMSSKSTYSSANEAAISSSLRILNEFRL